MGERLSTLAWVTSFSVTWMEDTESENVASETVGQQFTKVKTAVTKSHVQEYGGTSFDSKPIGDFEGSEGQMISSAQGAHAEGNGVNSRQVEVHQAYYKVNRARTALERKVAEAELAAILQRRRTADTKFAAIAFAATKQDAARAEEMLEGDVSSLANVACHKAALEKAVRYCGAFDDYSMRYSRLFANLCSAGTDDKTISSAIESGCS